MTVQSQEIVEQIAFDRTLLPEKCTINYSPDCPYNEIFQGKFVESLSGQLKVWGSTALQNNLPLVKSLDWITSVIPTVSGRLKSFMEQFCPKDVQFFPVLFTIGDEVIEDYWGVNIVHALPALDLVNSNYRYTQEGDYNNRIKHRVGDPPMPEGMKIFSVLKPVYVKGSLGPHHIARDSIYPGIVVSESLKQVLLRDFKGLYVYQGAV